MIVAHRHNALGLILDAQYEEAMVPLQRPGAGLGWVTSDASPLHPNPPSGQPTIPYFQRQGLGYYAVDDNPLAGIFDTTTSKIALALGIAAGVGGGIVLWRRRGARRRRR